MKKKVFSLMMTLLLAFVGVAKAEVVVIGDGGTSTNSYLPNYEFYNYSLTQQIYTADEIGTAGTINSIAFYYGGTATRTLDIYMVNTTVGSFADNNGWITVTAADKVYSGSVTYTANAWNTFVLDTPFAYDGTSNLAVIVDDNTGSYVSSIASYVFDATGMALRIYSDGTNYDPMAPPMGSGAVLNVKNQIQLDITPGGGGAGQVVEVTIGDPTSTLTNSYLPTYSLYNYSFTQQIYTADEIGVGGTISTLTMWLKNSSTYARNLNVYMKEVSESAFANGSAWVSMTANDMVATATLANGISNPVETTITLSTPFAYTGDGNLVICVQDVTGSWSSGAAGVVTSASDYQAIYAYRDASLYDPAAPGVTGYTTTSKNVVRLNITTGGGEAQGDKLHVKYIAGEEEIIDELNMGVRPAGAWMEPFNFTMYSEGPTYTVNVLDFTPSDGLFTVEGEELPFQVAPDADVELTLVCNGTQAGVIERQFVAITEGNRAAHIWPVTVELYAPEVPDVWELACEEATTFPFVEVPATAHNTVLHNDYTLPFPEIEEGVDAVYKLVFTEDQMLNASVTFGENGKVALYREGFEGEGGPMATNYYTGDEIAAGGGAAGAPFEAQIGEGTSTTGYFPFYTLYNYSIAENLFLASELEAAGVTTAPMTSLSWYATNTTGYNQQGITIWMANVDDEALTTTSHVVTNMTKVYTGAMTPLVGWNEFVFNEGNFAWDGSSNILIFCQRNNGEWNSTISWQATSSMPFNAMAYRYQDSGAYDPTIANTMYTSTIRPNIIMKADGRNRATFAYDFETDLQGWTNIDNDGDGYGWVVATDLYTGTEGYGANESDNFAMGFSYASGYAFDCDDYLVSPQAYAIGNGASLNFYHDQQSSSYPDYMEVCVSTAATPSASNFTAIWNNGGQRMGNGGQGRNGFNRLGNWVNATIDLSAYAGQNVWIAFHHQAYDQYAVLVDEVTVNTGNGSTPPTPPTPGTTVEYNAGPVIENLPVLPGTYYLVASSTTPDFEVTINAEDMPCPPVEEFAFNPVPADDADEIEPASVTLTWSIPAYATGWRLVFGSTYYPDPNHPQTILYPEDGSFTNAMANSYTVRNLWNNTNYFWHVEFNNDGCPEGVSSPIWGFTTHLNVPQNLRAADETVFDDETIVLNWNAVVDRTYRMYNVYRDGELIGHTQMNNIGNTTYTDGPLAYNMAGYTYYVTAVYDEGESAPSNTVNVKVSGRGNVDGHVYEQDGTTGIAGATVTMTGIDEFNVSHTYNFTTNAQGYYSGAVYAGTYNGQAAKDGYQTITEPVQGNPIALVYNQTTSPVDYMLDENFDPVCTVIAEYYPDSLDPQSPYVKVYWGCGLPGEEIIEPFETGDFSQFDWQLDPTYPWSITTNNPYEGTYCMK
ncbi:MAG: choice-of-anchor J domain-containing protein, partial [Muribaculaceae bacterium]|nr:choice-of-anchor J domain-containing protein [Muribaculaceae bacterium]